MTSSAILAVTFLFVVFGGLGLGSAWHYFRYEQGSQEPSPVRKEPSN